MDILAIIVLAQLLLIGFLSVLIYKLNEKVMIMNRSKDVYEYLDGQTKAVKDDLSEPEDIDLASLDDEVFRKAITK